MIRRKAKKPGRPRKATHAPRFHVSVSAGTYRAMQVAAVRRGVTLGVLVEEACGVSPIREAEVSVDVRAEWCDVIAERAGI